VDSTDSTCTVYFDGGCPLCCREVAHYRALVGAETIAWVDVASSDTATLGPGLTREAALARMHLRREDGSLLSGAAAFAALWSALRPYRWLGRLASWPPVLGCLEIGYRGFLRVRRVWRAP